MNAISHLRVSKSTSAFIITILAERYVLLLTLSWGLFWMESPRDWYSVLTNVTSLLWETIAKIVPSSVMPVITKWTFSQLQHSIFYMAGEKGQSIFSTRELGLLPLLKVSHLALRQQLPLLCKPKFLWVSQGFCRAKGLQYLCPLFRNPESI